jgi:hypothetical protein
MNNKLPHCKEHDEEHGGYNHNCHHCTDIRFKGAMSVRDFIASFTLTAAQIVTLERLRVAEVLY